MPNQKQELPELLLENDDQGDDANPYELAQELGKQGHLKGLNQLVNKVDGEDSEKDSNGNRAACEAVELVENDRDQDDVQQLP